MELRRIELPSIESNSTVLNWIDTDLYWIEVDTECIELDLIALKWTELDWMIWIGLNSTWLDWTDSKSTKSMWIVLGWNQFESNCFIIELE